MEDSFKVRVDRLFGSRLFESVPRSSFPDSSWSVTEGDVERKEWNREGGTAFPGREDMPCASAYDECFAKRTGRSGAAKKHRFEDDLDDEEEEEGEGKGGDEDGDDAVRALRTGGGEDRRGGERLLNRPTNREPETPLTGRQHEPDDDWRFSYIGYGFPPPPSGFFRPPHPKLLEDAGGAANPHAPYSSGHSGGRRDGRRRRSPATSPPSSSPLTRGCWKPQIRSHSTGEDEP